MNLRSQLRPLIKVLGGGGGDPPPRPDVSPIDELGKEIQAVLREDLATGGKLAQKGYGAGGWEFNGYCAVASAAYFFLAGGRDAGYQPMQRTDPDDGSSHWWLLDRAGKVIDQASDVR